MKVRIGIDGIGSGATASRIAALAGRIVAAAEKRGPRGNGSDGNGAPVPPSAGS